MPRRGTVRRVAWSTALLFAVTFSACRQAAEETPILMLAAASTIDAVEAASTAFRADTGITPHTSFGATSMLARQLSEGAPAGLMLAASSDWADQVSRWVEVSRRVTVASNRIVVVAPSGNTPAPVTLQAIADDDRFGAIAIADPNSVPAGIYAREALVSSGLWEALASRIIPTVDVRAALRLAERGEVDAAFVYLSDARKSKNARPIHEVDPALHAAIEYPLLLLATATEQEALFFDFLVSENGRAFFLDAGFALPPH